MKKIIIALALTALAAYAFAASPIVSNVVATPSAGQVNISYDLSADAACTVNLLVSSDNGSSYRSTPLTAVSGAIGNSVSAGLSKQIIWHPAGDGMQVGSQYVVKVIARDNPSPTAVDDFIFVEGGTFWNDLSWITVSSFYIDKYELTQAEYLAVMGSNPSSFIGIINGPVERVIWFDAIVYCNRRSVQEGLTPSYSYSTYGTNPANWPSGWNTDSNNHANVSCNWTANGYRLPTEMEWMFAALGGNQTHYYYWSGSNSFDDVTWHRENSGLISHTVGTKAANELGIHDMSGNVWEWVWDIFGYYPSGPQTNPTGVTSGSQRGLRGGSWENYASNCQVSDRGWTNATYVYSDIGFRVVRISP